MDQSKTLDSYLMGLEPSVLEALLAIVEAGGNIVNFEPAIACSQAISLRRIADALERANHVTESKT